MSAFGKIAAAVCTASLLVAGCGGGETPTPIPAAPGIATLDSEGGIVAGQDGATLTVPRGAIGRPTTLTIARDSNDAPARRPPTRSPATSTPSRRMAQRSPNQ